MANQYDYIHKDDRASQYAIQVVNKEILTSEAVYNSAKRHLSDIKRSLDNNDEFPYYWDYEKSDQIIKFGEMMPNPSDGQPLELLPFQCFLLGSTVGWRTLTGAKRYRTVNISMARKNSKSMIQGIVSLYTLLFETNPSQNKQIQLGANSRKQSNILMEFVKQMAQKLMSQSNSLKNQIKIIQGKVEHLPSHSFIENISSEAGNQDGANTLLFIFDEVHSARNRDLLNVMESGMVLNENAQTILISTVGTDVNRPYKEMWELGRKVASGEVKDERYFSFIAYNTLEEVDFPELWEKSNPLLSSEEIKRVLLTNLKDDKNKAEAEKNLEGFLIKNLNIWVHSSTNSFLSLEDWENCAIDKQVDIRGTDVWIGVDLARLNDLGALGYIHAIGNQSLFLDTHVFVGVREGLDNKIKRDDIDYKMWVDNGIATISDQSSGVISVAQIVEEMVSYIDSNNLNLKGIMYDPHMSEFLIQYIEKHYKDRDFLMIEVGQNWKNLSYPIKQLQIGVYNKEILHNNNPALDNAVFSAKSKFDNNDNIMLIKDRQREKIDSIIAIITAYSEAMYFEFQNSSNLSVEDILSEDFGF